MLLNPDTIVEQGAIRALIDFMDSHPSAGIVGSRLENAQGEAEASAHNSPSPLGELESSARLGPLSRVLHRYRVSPPVRDTAQASVLVRLPEAILREAFRRTRIATCRHALALRQVIFGIASCATARVGGDNERSEGVCTRSCPGRPAGIVDWRSMENRPGAT